MEQNFGPLKCHGFIIFVLWNAIYILCLIKTCIAHMHMSEPNPECTQSYSFSVIIK